MRFTSNIDLSQRVVFAQGGGSNVYEHPTVPNMLLKIPRQDARKKMIKKLTSFLRKSKRRYGVYREWFTEYEEYIATLNKTGTCPDFIPRYLGFSNTSDGLALLVEKVQDESGMNTALNLENYIKSSDAHGLEDCMHTFFDKILQYQVVFRDIELANLCVVRDVMGKPVRIVCVDGLGDFTLFKIRVWFKFAYCYWHKKEKIRIMNLILNRDV